MKALMLIALTSLSFGAMAETMHEINIKKEMLDRVELMIDKIDLAKKHLNKHKVVEACALVEELFKIYPDHLTAVGAHMNLERKRVNDAKDSSLNELVKFHQYSNSCKEGQNSEFVDMDKMGRGLYKIKLSLMKQRSVISQYKTNKENEFYYEYEF